jgi:hypothetical protein
LTDSMSRHYNRIATRNDFAARKNFVVGCNPASEQRTQRKPARFSSERLQRSS